MENFLKLDIDKSDFKFCKTQNKYPYDRKGQAQKNRFRKQIMSPM